MVGRSEMSPAVDDQERRRLCILAVTSGAKIAVAQVVDIEFEFKYCRGTGLVRPGFRGVGLLDKTCCCPIRAEGGQHGATRLSSRVSPTSSGPCGGRATRGGRRAGPGAQRPDDLQLAPARSHHQGLEAGLTSAERAELLSARRRIHELETELAIHRRAAELLKGTTSPKGGSRQSR